MANYISIDSGTTNTRISLVENGKIINTLKFPCGTKGSREQLILTLKNGIESVLNNNGFSQENIEKIIASGMITSELGLINLDHISAPAGIKELNSSMAEAVFEEISSIPFSFIRGIKTGGSSLCDTDMLRGEEAEIFGIAKGEGVYVLSGSHSKIITVDSLLKITEFKTMLTGELLGSIAKYTILKESVKDVTVTADEEYLLLGHSYAKEHGINEALFKTRVLKNIFKKTDGQVFGFLMGAVLCDEVEYILSLNAERVTLAGTAIFRRPLSVILNKLSSKNIITLTDAEVDESVTLGQIKIFEYKK